MNEKLFRGVKFDVELRDVPTRDGQTARREVVVHPGAVVVLPLLDGDRVVLIRNHRFSIDETLWELCAGTLEPGEEPAATAARELVEETGYDAARIELGREAYRCAEAFIAAKDLYIREQPVGGMEPGY